uniref:Hemicentin-1 n=1 Tax=Clytia hemisphaerica TaxID=252671 RepID=A0A7M5US14_9CNID
MRQRNTLQNKNLYGKETWRQRLCRKDKETGVCDTKVHCPVNGYWSSWSSYSSCSVSCDKGTHYRTRTCMGKKHGGKDCVGKDKETGVCDTKVHCPVNGYWSSWSSYSSCSVSCDKGTHYRTRTCMGKKHGGKDCVGKDKETGVCDTKVHCPVNGYWSSWSSYSSCSVSCDKGTHYRTRTCMGKKHGGKDCVGKDKETGVCDTKVHCPVNGYWSQWSSYGECSVSCDKGTHYRTRTCIGTAHGGKVCVGESKQSGVCDTKVKCPVDGYWSQWSAYGQCSETCGKGTQYRKRTCVGQAHGGKDCVGESKQSSVCDTKKKCPEHGYWSNWSEYSDCSVTCAKGTQFRTRICEGRKHGGDKCEGEAKETRVCDTKVHCPVNGYWSQWSSYGECSVSCNKGTHYRTRTCIGTAHGGKVCVGESKESGVCDTKVHCPVNGYWSQWSSYGECSVSCNKGTHYRTRTCIGTAHGGKVCVGESKQSGVCDTKVKCPVDGYWSQWSAYGQCSETCGKGTQYRKRTCVGQAHGGKDCVGESKQSSVCDTKKKCPEHGYWSNWSEYSDCSVTCAKGTQFRTRICEGQKHGGDKCEGEAKETRVCDTEVYCPVDGYWSQWSSYGECSVSCNKGTHYRTRTCIGTAHGGKVCEGESKQSGVCDTKVHCPSDGAWGSWSSYSKCSVSCDKGTHYRTRTCVGKKHGGKDCVGEDKETGICDTKVPCPVNGYWSSWSSYGECSVSCGVGTHYRTRTCIGAAHGGKFCVGESKQSGECDTKVHCPSDGVWGSWSKYGECSVTCGKGTHIRSRTCIGKKHGGKDCVGNSQESGICNTNVFCGESVAGGWGEWSEYGPCSKNCKGGYQTRHRYCNNPKPKNGGKYCVGDGYESKSCGGDGYCPIDGYWAQWSSYTACSKTCGEGRQSRTRKCNPPQHGGKKCIGLDEEERKCTVRGCKSDGKWSQWSSYGQCSVSCAKGTQMRTRTCVGQANGGKGCNGKDKQTRVCDTKVQCAVDGYWSQWSSYGECSVTCEKGTHYRTRTCVGKKHGGKDCEGESKQSGVCDTKVHCPSDGAWGSWSSYGECSVTCGKGTHYRTRTCVGKKHGGKDCVGETKQSGVCDTKIKCPVDGYWSQWSAFGQCSETCGKGTQYRKRTCIGQAHGGKDCVGESKQSSVCDTKKKCPEHGYWSNWSEYSDCSVTCAKGTQFRTRICEGQKHGGDKCEGEAKETRVCDTEVYCPVDGEWSQWSSYGECSVTCEKGTHYRTRTCVGKKHGGKDCEGESKQSGVCDTKVHCPSDGAWGSWSSYGECSVTCGKGTHYRTRACVGKKHGGKECIGETKQSGVCDTKVKCPVDGYWSQWSAYGQCSETCGKGTQYRTRTCVGPAHGGKDCVGESKQSSVCDTKKKCPEHGYWSNWSEYSDCSADCGKGTQFRTRVCEGRKHGGDDCEGKAKETRVCDTKKHCPVDGKWSQWSEYSECSVTCGNGKQYRTRTCEGKKHGGKDCVGEDKEEKKCELEACLPEPYWAQWGAWSSCSNSCGKGTQTRARICMKDPRQVTTCVGAPTQTQSCQLKPCQQTPVCTCQKYKLEQFTCLKWDKAEIEKQFEGKCFLDKARLAYKAVEKLLTELRQDMADTRKCRLDLRKQLIYGSTEIFTAYDHCVTLGSCKFIRLREQLEDKLFELKRLISTEEEGFGSLNPLRLLGW